MRRLGLFFPGYGAQQVGMGKEFYDHYRVVQEVFEEAGNCTGINFVKLCFASSERELSRPLNAYLALFVVQAALFEVLREHGVKPALTTGWGVGYVSAQYASGVFSLPDGLYVLKKYVTFLTEMMQSRDIVVIRVSGVDRGDIELFLREPEIKGHAALAVVYRTGDCLLVGARAAIDVLKTRLVLYYQARIMDQQFGYGVHALCIEEFLTRFNLYLEKVDFRPLRHALITPDGTFLTAGQCAAREVLTRFFYEPVDVAKVMRLLADCDLFVQVGPDKVVHDKFPYLADRQVLIFNHFQDIAKVKHEYRG